MAVYVYKIADGSLVSWCPNDTDPVASAAQLAAKGLASVSGLAGMDATHAWDAPTHTVVTVAAPAPVLSTWQFILLFTAIENSAIRASTDDVVQHFFDALRASQTVDLNNIQVRGGVNYLVSVGLLTQANASLILSGQASQ